MLSFLITLHRLRHLHSPGTCCCMYHIETPCTYVGIAHLILNAMYCALSSLTAAASTMVCSFCKDERWQYELVRI